MFSDHWISKGTGITCPGERKASMIHLFTTIKGFFCFSSRSRQWVVKHDSTEQKPEVSTCQTRTHLIPWQAVSPFMDSATIFYKLNYKLSTVKGIASDWLCMHLSVCSVSAALIRAGDTKMNSDWVPIWQSKIGGPVYWVFTFFVWGPPHVIVKWIRVCTFSALNLSAVCHRLSYRT